MSSEVDDAAEGDGDGIAVYGSLARSEGKSTVCAGFGTGKTNAVRFPLALGDLALDIASVGLLNAPIPGASAGSRGDRSVERDRRECDESTGSKSAQYSTENHGESPHEVLMR